MPCPRCCGLFFKRAWPFAVLPPTGQKPWTPSSFLAFFTAAPHLLITFAAFAFLARADAFLETILPRLFLTRSDFLRPPEVRSLVPLKTLDFPRLPFAIFETFMALLFMLFLAIFILFLAIFILFLAIFMLFIALF